jgi:hypothetical protein
MHRLGSTISVGALNKNGCQLLFARDDQAALQLCTVKDGEV